MINKVMLVINRPVLPRLKAVYAVIAVAVMKTGKTTCSGTFGTYIANINATTKLRNQFMTSSINLSGLLCQSSRMNSTARSIKEYVRQFQVYRLMFRGQRWCLSDLTF